jgi:hypothetical protein
MGLLSMLSSLFGKKKMRICNVIVVGLHNSGKSTFVNDLKPPTVFFPIFFRRVCFEAIYFQTKSLSVLPTVGFSVEELAIFKLVSFESGDDYYFHSWKTLSEGSDIVLLLFII